MDFPATPSTEAGPPSGLSIQGVKWFGRGRFDVLIELADAETVRGFEPDLVELAALGGRAVVITAPADGAGIDCESRVFGPNVGIPEDSVTGSAHCTLAVHWGERLGKTELVGHQASARGGTVYMRRLGDRVVLGGAAVTVSTVEMVA
jgi:predicted PhzF superfamily epimerase YddE/YHI9